MWSRPEPVASGRPSTRSAVIESRLGISYDSESRVRWSGLARSWPLPARGADDDRLGSHLTETRSLDPRHRCARVKDEVCFISVVASKAAAEGRMRLLIQKLERNPLTQISH